MSYNTDAARWRALTIRDANANGRFVYAVKSTNIYCRPICPARLARRANVGFYKTPLEAEADGFRACKRCKPNTTVEDPQERAVEKACAIIEEALKKDDPKAFRLQDLAKTVGLTPRYFHKIFKDKTGKTPKEYVDSRRSQSSSSTTPAMSTGLDTPTNTDADDWESFKFNDFSELVDFDADASATLGFNLMTGAAQPSAMGYGNAIDVNILHQMWDATYEPNGTDLDSFLESEKLLSVTNPVLMADSSNCPTPENTWPTVSTLELDAAAILGWDDSQIAF